MAAERAGARGTWGGASLYRAVGQAAAGGARRESAVSLARPLAAASGSGTVLRWEYPFARWVERIGFDAAYAADIDLELHPETLTGRRLVVIVGHPEYWSVTMRRAVEAALAAGTNLAFLAANAVYWRIRLEAGSDGPGRTIVCYKDAARDPLAAMDPAQATVRWRNDPGVDPESQLIGQQYAHICSPAADFVVTDPSHWLFERTGMAAGDRLAGLVGPEYDSVDVSPEAPAGLAVLARSPVVARTGQESGGLAIPGAPSQTATFYHAPSGASVFSAGTIQWSWGLDGWSSRAAGLGRTRRSTGTPVDPRVGVITSNLLSRLGWRAEA